MLRSSHALGHADEHLLARMNIELFGGFTRQPKDALSGDDESESSSGASIVEHQPTPTPTDAPATAAPSPEGSREPATEPPQTTSTAAVSSAELDPAAVLAGSLLRVTIQPRPNNDGETTPLDRPADSLLLRLWQRLSGRR